MCVVCACFLVCRPSFQLLFEQEKIAALKREVEATESLVLTRWKEICTCCVLHIKAEVERARKSE